MRLPNLWARPSYIALCCTISVIRRVPLDVVFRIQGLTVHLRDAASLLVRGSESRRHQPYADCMQARRRDILHTCQFSVCQHGCSSGLPSVLLTNDDQTGWWIIVRGYVPSLHNRQSNTTLVLRQMPLLLYPGTLAINMSLRGLAVADPCLLPLIISHHNNQ